MLERRLTRVNCNLCSDWIRNLSISDSGILVPCRTYKHLHLRSIDERAAPEGVLGSGLPFSLLKDRFYVSQKWQKYYKHFFHHMGSFELRMQQNPFLAAARSPGSSWRAYSAPPDPLVGWGGDTPSVFPSPRRLLHLDFAAFGASLLGEELEGSRGLRLRPYQM